MMVRSRNRFTALVAKLVLGILVTTPVANADMVFKYNSRSTSGMSAEKPAETSESCYDPTNIGEIGTSQGCEGMLIVDNDMIRPVASPDAPLDGGWTPSGGGNGTFYIYQNGKKYSFADTTGDSNVGNIFTGQVTDMSSLFADVNFNGDIRYWDTSGVTDMYCVFWANPSFNQDISDWDVSKVEDMEWAFGSATSFNKDIGSWDTSSADDMDYMFNSASNFNQDVSSWDVSNVTSHRSFSSSSGISGTDKVPSF